MKTNALRIENCELRICESQRDSIDEPRVVRHELPWAFSETIHSTPTGLQPRARKVMQPRWGWDALFGFTQGSLADSATLGWEVESLQDSQVFNSQFTISGI
jgi:hypothetical protein